MYHEDGPARSSPPWTANIIHTCMGVEPGERVLIVVDEPLRFALDPLLAEALEAGPAELWTFTFSNAARPFTEFPGQVLDRTTQVNAVVTLLSSFDPVVELPAHVAARSIITSGNPRYAVGAYIDQGFLEHELSADYEQIRRVSLPGSGD